MHGCSQNSISELQIVYKQMRNLSLPGSRLPVEVLSCSFQLALRKAKAAKGKEKIKERTEIRHCKPKDHIQQPA